MIPWKPKSFLQDLCNELRCPPPARQIQRIHNSSALFFKFIRILHGYVNALNLCSKFMHIKGLMLFLKVTFFPLVT